MTDPEARRTSWAKQLPAPPSLVHQKQHHTRASSARRATSFRLRSTLTKQSSMAVGAGLIVGAGLSRRLSKKLDMSWDRLEGVAWGGLPWLSNTVREGAGRALTRPLASQTGAETFFQGFNLTCPEFW